MKINTRIQLPRQGLECISEVDTYDANLHDLQRTSYTGGFRLATFSETISILSQLHTLYSNASGPRRDEKSMAARRILRYMRHGKFTADTVIHYHQEGLFIENHPTLREQQYVNPEEAKNWPIERLSYPEKDDGVDTPSQRTLESRLGSHEERGVVFSDDKNTRFVPYGFKNWLDGDLKYGEIEHHPMIIGLFGGAENARRWQSMSCSSQWPEYSTGSAYTYGCELRVSSGINHVSVPRTEAVHLHLKSGGRDAGTMVQDVPVLYHAHGLYVRKLQTNNQ